MDEFLGAVEVMRHYGVDFETFLTAAEEHFEDAT